MKTICDGGFNIFRTFSDLLFLSRFLK